MSVKKYADSTGLTEFWAKVKTLVSGKQDTLVSGTNIKTINNNSLLGSGNLSISGGGVIVSSTAPTGDASILWIDTGDGNIAKYWNGTAWSAVRSVWG